MFGFFGKKKEEQPQNQPTKEQASQEFSNYVKRLMSTDNKGSFFMLVRNNSFGGKAIVGDGPMMENLFGQLFHEHPEVLGLIEQIIQRFKAGTAVYKKDSEVIDAPIDPEVIELAKKISGDENVKINRKSPWGVTNDSQHTGFPNPTPQEAEALGSLLKTILGKEGDEKKPDVTDPLYPRHEMKKEHEKYQKKLKEKGLDGFDLDDIRNRNKE